ncbi:toll/interleukin-1 receptor domain-containing protein [uncultured Thiodictyon sp.]|jgi:hypothetical protein|uniref:toll/interleukin-1 receptor domain-containing protein n=1 Tax=uncultured Thiodictyon sp. TaxID=1846217 RepID=UPI0025EAD0B6|nr:toll/interleukin-1 receptor domain-containing protein [uncultured Thiodictyon sp.]
MQVFISHVRADAKLAERIAQVLRDTGLQVWDDTQILPGDNWAEKLAEGLEQSDAMVVLFTPDSAHSDAIRRSEVGYALGKKDFKKPNYAVMAFLSGTAKPISWGRSNGMIDFQDAFDTGCRNLLRSWGVGYQVGDSR